MSVRRLHGVHFLALLVSQLVVDAATSKAEYFDEGPTKLAIKPCVDHRIERRVKVATPEEQRVEPLGYVVGHVVAVAQWYRLEHGQYEER